MTILTQNLVYAYALYVTAHNDNPDSKLADEMFDLMMIELKHNVKYDDDFAHEIMDTLCTLDRSKKEPFIDMADNIKTLLKNYK